MNRTFHMRRVYIGILVLAGFEVFATDARCGPNENAKVLISLPSVDLSPCANGVQSCNDVNTAGRLYPPRTYYAFLLIADGDGPSGISAVKCGINYDPTLQTGVDVFGWALCANAEIRTTGPNGLWPAPQSGNLITWTDENCQRDEPAGSGSGVVAAAGYFYCAAYTADDLRIELHPTDGLVTVGSCAADVDTVEGGGITRNPSHLGFARFSPGGLEEGYNPCESDTPVQPATWGRIKLAFQSH